MRRRVVCGLSETIATLPPQSAFTSVDLPTFGRPATATKPDFTGRSQVSGRSCEAGAYVGDRAVLAAEVDALDPPLVQPLAAAAARRRGDADRVDVAGAHALARSLRDRRPLRADAERIGRVLDVHAVDDAAVLQQQRRADEIVRVRRVRVRGGRLRARDELLAGHDSTWKTTSVTSAPSAPP